MCVCVCELFHDVTQMLSFDDHCVKLCYYEIGMYFKSFAADEKLRLCGTKWQLDLNVTRHLIRSRDLINKTKNFLMAGFHVK